MNLRKGNLMTKEEFNALFNAYLEDSITPADELAFFKAIASDAFDSDLSELIGALFGEVALFNKTKLEKMKSAKGSETIINDDEISFESPKLSKEETAKADAEFKEFRKTHEARQNNIEDILDSFRQWWVPKGRELPITEYNKTIDALIAELQLLKLPDELVQPR